MPYSMKALVLEAAGRPFTLKDVPDPVPGPGEAVVRVIACGAGLTIQHVRAGRIKVDYPRIIGHEITGVVEALGAGVNELKVGDAVTAYFYLTCGYCRWCRSNRETLCENFGGYVGRAVDGGYAELMKLPAKNFLKIPDGLDWKKYPAEVGVICDAIATPVKVIRHARVTAWDTVAVFGAGGGLGIHMLMLAKWAHAERVIAVDVATDKFDACRKAGADECVNPAETDAIEALRELTGGKGVDVVIDFVSSQATLNAGFEALGRGGRLVTLGGSGQEVRASARHLLDCEAMVMGSRYATKQEVIDSLELVARGEVWPMVTDVRPMREAETLHQKVEKGGVTGRAAILIE
jgi:propanol-preferring alcohol dehydrogenase